MKIKGRKNNEIELHQLANDRNIKLNHFFLGCFYNCSFITLHMYLSQFTQNITIEPFLFEVGNSLHKVEKNTHTTMQEILVF